MNKDSNFLLKNNINNDSQYSPTLRKISKIPKFPKNSEELKKIPSYIMQESEIINEELIFNDKKVGFDYAIRDGFFLLKIPANIDLHAGDSFVNNFFKNKTGDSDDIYKGFKNTTINKDYQGYFDREHDQWENFYIESENWSAILPTGVEKLGHQMTDLGIIILKNVLQKIGIPKEEWDLITSGLSNKNGHQMLAFNHFRTHKNTRGTKFHRDSGWVTILRSFEPGLMTLIEDQFYSINPKEGYFIINFGSSIEVLTEKMETPVRANIHGVTQIIKKPGELNRTSYVVFLDSNLSGHIFSYEAGKANAIQTVKEFAIQEVGRTYDEDENTV